MDDEEEDAKTKLIWQEFFRKLDFTVKKSNNYADILIDKGIGKIDLLVKRCARKPTYLVDIGFDEDDVDEIMEALQKLNAPSLDRRESSGANVQQPPPANEALPPATPVAQRAESSHDLVREASVQHLFLEIRSFTVKGVLGEGGMARAYHCVYAGTHVAVKEVSNEKNRAQFLHEIQVHSKFNHPFVVGVMGVVKARIETLTAAAAAANELKQLAAAAASSTSKASSPPPPQYRLVEDPDRRLLVVHYCSQGSLRDFLKLVRTGRYGFDEATCLRIVHEVAAGMAFLHAHNIVHLDLKPANIFLKDGWTAQVGDFGLATEVQKRLDSDTFVPSDNGDSTMAAFCHFNGGTFYYLPPEAFTTKKMTKRSDVFAYAVVLHNVFVTQDDDHIYDPRDVLGDGDPTRYQLIFIDKLVNHALRPALRDPPRVTLTRRLQQRLFALMQRGWQHDAAQRPSFESVAEELSSLRETLDEARGATPPPPFVSPLASASGDGGKGDARRLALLRDGDGDGDGDDDAATAADAAVAGGGSGLGDTLRVEALRLTSTTFYLDGPAAASAAAAAAAATGGDAFVCGLCRRGGFSAPAAAAAAAVDGAASPPSSSAQGPRHFVCERCLCTQLTRQSDALLALTAATAAADAATASASAADALRFERHDEALCCPLCLSGGGSGGARRVSFYALPQLASLLHATPSAAVGGGDSGGGGGGGGEGDVTAATALLGYFAPQRALLAHCARCDTTTSLDVTCRDTGGRDTGDTAAAATPLDRVAVAYDALRAAVAVPFREFLAAASRFSFDADADVDVDAFYAAVVTRFLPTLQLRRGGGGDALFDAVLRVVTPPQRRAALQLRYWRDRPLYRHQRVAALHHRRDTDRDTGGDTRDTDGDVYPPATRIATPRDELRYLVAVLRGVDALRCGACQRCQPVARAALAPRHPLLQRL
eukprot:gene13197-9452_t